MCGLEMPGVGNPLSIAGFIQICKLPQLNDGSTEIQNPEETQGPFFCADKGVRFACFSFTQRLHSDDGIVDKGVIADYHIHTKRFRLLAEVPDTLMIDGNIFRFAHNIGIAVGGKYMGLAVIVYIFNNVG